MIRRKLWPERQKIIGGRRKLHNSELHIFFSLPIIICFIKQRKYGYSWRVASLEKMRNTYRIFVRRPQGRDHLEDLIVVEKIILSHVKPPGSIKAEIFLTNWVTINFSRKTLYHGVTTAAITITNTLHYEVENILLIMRNRRPALKHRPYRNVPGLAELASLPQSVHWQGNLHFWWLRFTNLTSHWEHHL